MTVAKEESKTMKGKSNVTAAKEVGDKGRGFPIASSPAEQHCSLATHSYGIVIGISNYLGAKFNVPGAKEDAKAFHQCLVEDLGVPITQVKLVTDENIPVQDCIDNAFLEVFEQARVKYQEYKSLDKEADLDYPRRLYVYFAGHGLAGLGESKIARSTPRLLMSNAEFNQLNRSLKIEDYHEWIKFHTPFEEQIFFL